jgi:hypothetical protein
METRMHAGQLLRSTPRLLVVATLAFAGTGCAMLGEIFYTRGLRLVVLTVVAVAAVGLFASRTSRR